ncbi:MAG: nucleotidyl transferase AbiEii/AbiGii toxin family protein [Candidatus Omnitrophota bacterium]
MIEVIKQQFVENMSTGEKINRVREFLQTLVLKIIYDKDYFNNLAFVGGTALRFLYSLRRFSEDLDFSLVNKEGYNFRKINAEVIEGFGSFGFEIESRPKDEKNVHSAMLRFKGLLKALGLSDMDEQKLSVKLEIDTNPPKGWNVQTSVVNKTYLLNIVHFDLSSSFATKLHACFYRKFVKGRDFYDLIWYLGKKIVPNFVLLNNAIAQTQGKNPGIDVDNFKEFILENLKKIDFDKAKADVERFLEDKNELKLFDFAVIRGAIELL